MTAFVFSLWSGSSTGSGGVRTLRHLNDDGTVAADVEVSRDDLSWGASADAVTVGDEVWVFAIDWTGSTSRFWFRPIGAMPGAVRLIEEGEDRERNLRSPTAVAVDDSALVFFLRAGEIWQFRWDGESSRDMVPIGATFSPDAKLVATASGNVTCLSVRERESGSLSVLRVEDGVVTDHRELTPSGMPFAPAPRLVGVDCEVPTFEPSATSPANSVVRVSSGRTVGGWGGTAPVGLEETEQGIVLAVRDPSGMGVAVHVLDPTTHDCTVDAPALRLPAIPVGAPAGALLGLGDLLVLAGLTSAGDVALARIHSSP